MDGHGDALEAFAAGITHRLQNDAQGADRFAKTATHIGAVSVAAGHAVEGWLHLHRQPFRQLGNQVVALEVAALPAEQPTGGGVGQHNCALGIQQHRPIGHLGDQGLLLHLGGGELLDVCCLVVLQLGGHGVEAVEQLP